MRVIVYIDGFNLFYGLKDAKACRWLDPVALADRLFPGDDVIAVRYFTARVKAMIDPGAPGRQDVYLRAIGANPRLRITYGRFLIQSKRYPLVSPPPGGSKWAHVWKPEEKGSDVNLAAQLLVDAFNGKFEKAGVISNDSDLKGPIGIVRRPPFGRPVEAFNPGHGRRTKMGATVHRDLSPADYAACLLPDPTVRPDGTLLTMPKEWVTPQ